ncbi:MAG: hypothetical protein JWM47_3340 [Acidimicrobiales bacterium]|nr:hypothetical protein [Acidimicrobiales bacterium]
MAWLLAPVYDRLVAATEKACFQAWRHDLLTDLHGTVLEIGAGTGSNLVHYPPAVDRLVLTEPDPGMRRRLTAKLEAARADRRFGPSSVEVLPDPAQRLSAPDGSVDAVVTTLVLCSVPDQAATLAELRRVLAPGGRLVFLEHVAADDRPERLKWQRRIDPVWKRVVGGCRLTRRTADAIADAGFTIDSLTRESARKAVPVVRPTIRGTATASPP